VPAPRPVPEAEGHWLLGNARELARAPHRFMTAAAARHGGIVQLRLLRRRVVVVSDPELAQQVLVSRWERYQRGTHNRNLGILGGEGLLSTEGEGWRKRRRQVQPAFRRECLERLVPAVTTAVDGVLASWERARVAGKAVPLGADMLRLAMSAMGRMLLSAEIPEAQGARLGVILHDALMLLRRRNTTIWPAPLWLPTPANRRLRGYRDELTRFAESHIRGRETAAASDPPDILDALLALRDPETGERLSHEALVDETKTLFVAGFETTATALTWTLYLLARHPEIAAKWRAEIDAALGGRSPRWEDLARLPYTAQILLESMRLYPPVYAIARRCIEDDELGGFHIPAGMPVLIAIYGVHRAPAWGGAAAQFRPERFESGWPKRAYMPFAAGPHLCIGNDFAMVEMTVALARIAQRYTLATVSDAPPGESARITLVPDREIFLRLEAR
jgi:enediyne biosynthesis protein E7